MSRVKLLLPIGAFAIGALLYAGSGVITLLSTMAHQAFFGAPPVRGEPARDNAPSFGPDGLPAGAAAAPAGIEGDQQPEGAFTPNWVPVPAGEPVCEHIDCPHPEDLPQLPPRPPFRPQGLPDVVTPGQEP